MEKQKLYRLFTLLDEALSLQPEKRRLFLEQACGDDLALKNELWRLLQTASKSEQFWNDWKHWHENQIVEIFRNLAVPEPEQKTIGLWRLIRLLGRGGMGNVWLAERADEAYEKKAAIKLMNRNFGYPDVHQSTIYRLEQERRILAKMDHPNIARLYDGGLTEEGYPWLAMEYVEGEPITRWCSQNNLTVQQRLKMFERVCEAIRYAHKNLVVHRDLKPENIFVTENGEVKILDFGIAKLLDDDFIQTEIVKTQSGVRAMSLPYAAPEQISGEPVTTATDVYALGLLLYELLTGTYPFDLDGLNIRQTEQLLRDAEPPRPGTAANNNGKVPGSRLIKGDLDAIIMKALRKEADQRYENAGQLLDDLKRFESNQPIYARKGTYRYKLQKWFHRHKITALSGSIAVLSLAIGSGIALWKAHEAGIAAETATIALDETEEALNRAEALRDVLMSLFWSAEPDRPPDQMPTTEEILRLGSEKAMGDEITEPSERLGVLLAIGEIYVRMGEYEQAAPLLNAAVELGYEYQERWPQELARALFIQSLYTGMTGNLEGEEELLLEAESLVENRQEYWEIFAKIRANRGFLEYLKRNYHEGVRLLEPLYEEMKQRVETDPEVKANVLNYLAGLYSLTGDLNKADQIREKTTNLLRETEGPESRSYATSLTNSVGLKADIGNFDDAIANGEKALHVYSLIYDEPTGLGGATHVGLSYAYLFSGFFEEALDHMDMAGRNFAHILELDFENWPAARVHRGILYAKMQEWETAEKYLIPAKEHFSTIHHTVSGLTSPHGLLAAIYCRNNKIEKGKEILADIDPDNGANPAQQARYFEALAVCHYHSVELLDALEAISRSLELMNYRGRAMVIAERKIFRARILSALGRHREANQELDKAEQLYLEQGLDDHPLLLNVESARNKLLSQL